MRSTEIISHAYQRLDQLTPLRDDCGRLCRQACCQEQDEMTGMYLFPGEAELLPPTVFGLIPTTIALDSGEQVVLAVCNGRCVRSERPLACRIFPLTPYITSEGRLTTIVDPRAMPLCPLTQSSGLKRIQPKFIRAVEDVAHILNNHEETRSFLKIISRLIDESITL